MLIIHSFLRIQGRDDHNHRIQRLKDTFHKVSIHWPFSQNVTKEIQVISYNVSLVTSDHSAAVKPYDARRIQSQVCSLHYWKSRGNVTMDRQHFQGQLNTHPTETGTQIMAARIWHRLRRANCLNFQRSAGFLLNKAIVKTT